MMNHGPGEDKSLAMKIEGTILDMETMGRRKHRKIVVLLILVIVTVGCGVFWRREYDFGEMGDIAVKIRDELRPIEIVAGWSYPTATQSYFSYYGLDMEKRIGGVEIDSECGGKGICNKDVVRIARGSQHLSKVTDIERQAQRKGKLAADQRLACQSRVVEDNGNIEVFIRDFGRYTILTDTVHTSVELEPAVAKKGDQVLYHTGEDLGCYEGRILDSC